jgi:hypothetical protein
MVTLQEAVELEIDRPTSGWVHAMKKHCIQQAYKFGDLESPLIEGIKLKYELLSLPKLTAF